MNFTMEYYLSKYEELSVLSDTKKCRTSLMRNKDTGELVVKKEMGKESFSVYSLLKSIKNKNLIKVLECFRDEDKTIEIEEYVNGKRLDDYFREKKAIVAALMVVMGVVALFNPFGSSTVLMMFVGIVLMVEGLSDLISIIRISSFIKNLRG